MSHYKLNKKCKKCGVRILDNNKSGFCNHHRDRTGVNNPFYGKKHKPETIEDIKKKLSIISKKLWQNPEYRAKVIKGTSKPRREGFKKEQSERIKQWYENNPEQRTLRSKAMKKSWKDGKITANNYSCNESNLEIDLFNDIKKIAPDAKRKQIIKIGKRWVFPDILIEEWGIIIEFYGNFFHANPKIYKKDDTILDKTALEVWEKDEGREERLQNVPTEDKFPKAYDIFIIWEDDYKNDKELILKRLDSRLNWEYSH